jgi:hypothetical protein
MQKPEPAIVDVNHSMAASAEVVETSERSPETPTTFAALTTLCQTLERAVTTSDSLEPQTKTCIRKLTKAAQGAFADRSIMLNENEELFQQNCEKVVRESAKATMVGKAKVMKFEDIQAAKRVREQKEAKKQAGQDRRGKKQKPVPNGMADRDCEKGVALQEIASLGLDDFCRVIEF